MREGSERHEMTMGSRDKYTLLLLLFFSTAGPRGTDVDKGGNHEYSTKDVDHFKEAERNYIFN